MDPTECERLLAEARNGNVAAMNELLGAVRSQLCAAAQVQLDSKVRQRVDASDIVQLTLFEAQKDFADFRGANSAEWQAWVRRILQHNVANEIERHIVAQKRAVGRERSLDESRGELGPLKQLLAGELTSASEKHVRKEALKQLQAAIEQLSVSQREAIRMRYLQSLGLAEVSEVMGRSEAAVAGLLKRGLRELRKQYMGPDGEQG